MSRPVLPARCPSCGAPNCVDVITKANDGRLIETTEAMDWINFPFCTTRCANRDQARLTAADLGCLADYEWWLMMDGA